MSSKHLEFSVLVWVFFFKKIDINCNKQETHFIEAAKEHKTDSGGLTKSKMFLRLNNKKYELI